MYIGFHMWTKLASWQVKTLLLLIALASCTYCYMYMYMSTYMYACMNACLVVGVSQGLPQVEHCTYMYITLHSCT